MTDPRPSLPDGGGPDLDAIYGNRVQRTPPEPPNANPARETPTDTGNAWRLARICSGELRYVPAEGKWLVWDGYRWVRDELGLSFHHTLRVCQEIRSHAMAVPEEQRAEWKNWSRASESVVRRKAMLDIAATLPELALRSEQLDIQPHLLNTPAGTVDLRTMAVRRADPVDLITRCTTVPIDLNHQWTPDLVEFAQTFQPGEGHWPYLMTVIGSCLRGYNDLRIWLLVHGPTTTGKSQFMDAVAHALGDYSSSVGTSVFRANQDDKPRPDLLRVLGARMVYASEGADSWELHADHVKRLTGGDPIVARGMRSNLMVERVPSFTPIIVCNTVPKVKGADAAVRRRLHVLEFSRSILGAEDPGKREAFVSDPDTLSALLTQLVIGQMAVYSQGIETGRPMSWVEATADAFSGLTNITAFIEEMRQAGLIVDVDPSRISVNQSWKLTELYNTYRMWLDQHGDAEDHRTRLSFRGFNSELRALGWDPPRKSAGVMHWEGKHRPSDANVFALFS